MAIPTIDTPEVTVTTDEAVEQITQDVASIGEVYTESPESEVQAPAPELQPEPEEKEVEDNAICLNGITLSTLLKLQNDRLVAINDEDEFIRLTNKVGTFEYAINDAINNYSVEADRIGKSIQQIVDKSRFGAKLVNADGKPILGSGMSLAKRSNGEHTLSGSKGKIELDIRRGRLKRIPLYNSGFYIDIVPVALNALNNFYSAIHDTIDKYGREFGVHFYLFNDLFIKESLVNLFVPLVVNSNLIGWKQGKTLLESISINDFKMILNAIVTKMHPNGFNYRHTCSNIGCRHNTEELIDANKFIHHDFMKLPPECIAHMSSMKDVTKEDLATYRKHLNMSYDYRQNDMEVNFSGTPSIFDYVEVGRMFNSTLIGNQFSDNNAEVYRALAFNYYRTFAPWIKSITRYNEDGIADATITDRELIMMLIDDIQTEDTERKLSDEFIKYVASTEISYLCYPVAPCPACGTVPETEAGYHPVDIEKNFFTLSVKRLNIG